MQAYLAVMLGLSALPGLPESPPGPCPESLTTGILPPPDLDQPASQAASQQPHPSSVSGSTFTGYFRPSWLADETREICIIIKR